ncbi:MAG: VOC family protein [Bacteroidales bacterium]
MLTHIHPKLPMRDKDTTRAYYVDQLGFRVFGRSDSADYLMVERDGIQMHFFAFPGLDPATNDGQVYIRTDDIDGLYQDLLDRGVAIHPNGKLQTKPWGQGSFPARPRLQSSDLRTMKRTPHVLPYALLPSRLLLFLLFQTGLALLFRSWERSQWYWLVTATLTNVVSIALLVVLFRREGSRFLDLFRFRKESLKRDLLLFSDSPRFPSRLRWRRAMP